MWTRRDWLQRSGTAVAACGMIGFPSRSHGAVAPEISGQWSEKFGGPATVSIHLSLLPTSTPDGAKLLSFGGVEKNPATGDKDGYTRTYVIDVRSNGPLNSSSTLVYNRNTALFCCGHTFLHDGRFISAGGQVNSLYFGASDINYFDYAPYQWTEQPTKPGEGMSGRWYPSMVTLANGRVLVLSGTINGQGARNPLPQVWKTNEGGGFLNLLNAQYSMGLYPKIFVAPDGSVVSVGPEPVTRFLDTTYVAPSGLLGRWTVGQKCSYGARLYGMGVMYDHGKIMIAGGGLNNNVVPTKTTEVLDLTVGSPASATWRSTKPMTYARRHANSTLLADGTVLVTGGSNAPAFNDINGAVMAAELWDPVTEEWTVLASAQVARIYHSTALLLPDGRVLTTGGTFTNGQNGGKNNLNAEIFSPPYLFKGNGIRPTVTSVPATASLGATISVSSPDATKLTMVRLGTATHTCNFNQRFNRLNATRVGSVLRAALPTDANRLLPGHYLLFALNAAGVPSIGRVIKVLPA